jgi:hypothetical protein
MNDLKVIIDGIEIPILPDSIEIDGKKVQSEMPVIGYRVEMALNFQLLEKDTPWINY